MTFLFQCLIIDAKFFVSCRHGVGAKNIHLQIVYYEFYKRLAFILFQVDGDGLLTDIGSHKIAVSILSSYRSADISVGIAFGFSAGHWSRLQSNDTPA